MEEGGTWRTVQQGDSVSSLAFENGLFWETVWNHNNNSDLKRQRMKQNVLLPGDRVFIPEKRIKEVTGDTDTQHKFKRKGVPERLNIRFLDLERKPIGDQPYTLEIDGDGRVISGQLDADGWLRESIPPNARRGHVKVGEYGEFAQMDLMLGHLDPLDEIKGVQGRLKNLGYYGGPIDGRTNEEFKTSILKFRRDHKLDESVEIDDPFRDKLQKIHGA